VARFSALKLRVLPSSLLFYQTQLASLPVLRNCGHSEQKYTHKTQASKR
jgi:hypothetical protein